MKEFKVTITLETEGDCKRVLNTVEKARKLRKEGTQLSAPSTSLLIGALSRATAVKANHGIELGEY